MVLISFSPKQYSVAKIYNINAAWLQIVDRTTIAKINFSPKVYSQKRLNFPFIRVCQTFMGATKQDLLLVTTLQYYILNSKREKNSSGATNFLFCLHPKHQRLPLAFGFEC